MPKARQAYRCRYADGAEQARHGAHYKGRRHTKGAEKAGVLLLAGGEPAAVYQ